MEEDDFDMDAMLAEEEAMAEEQAAMASVSRGGGLTGLCG